MDSLTGVLVRFGRPQEPVGTRSSNGLYRKASDTPGSSGRYPAGIHAVQREDPVGSGPSGGLQRAPEIGSGNLTFFFTKHRVQNSISTHFSPLIQGAFTYKGQMIDMPSLLQAKNVLAIASRAEKSQK